MKLETVLLIWSMVWLRLLSGYARISIESKLFKLESAFQKTEACRKKNAYSLLKPENSIKGIRRSHNNKN